MINRDQRFDSGRLQLGEHLVIESQPPLRWVLFSLPLGKMRVQLTDMRKMLKPISRHSAISSL